MKIFILFISLSVLANVSIAATNTNQDLKNITNISAFKFSAAQQQKLKQNNFVISPSDVVALEFFQIYEENRYAKIPNFVTVDSVLHTYHLLYDFLLRDIEKKQLTSQLQKLNKAMLTASEAQFKALQHTPWENAARRNLAFFAVGAKLLEQNYPVPAVVVKEVNEELKLIADHREIAPVVVLNIGVDPTKPLNLLQEDYSQYIPRGHYTKDKQLQAYFKAMMWYGRMTFRMHDPDAIRSASLISLALQQPQNAQLWSSISETINFFVGKSDDVGYRSFASLLHQVYGKDATLADLTKSPEKFTQLVAAARKLEAPKINSIPIFNAKLQPDRDAAVTGFRFLGQRFTIDAAVFQQLIVRAVGPKGEQCRAEPYSEGRMLPKALDFPAALGSKMAADILKKDGEYAYACYPENMQKLQNYFAGLSATTWQQNLYWQWLYALAPLLQPKPAAQYPNFMLSDAWLKKDLLTYLGSFTELKHDTVLYVKQVYAEMGDGEEEVDDRGYVEPEVQVYVRLADLLAQTKKGLQLYSLLTANNQKIIETMQQFTANLVTISKKELAQSKLTSKEYDFIRYFGGDLEHFWIECFRDAGVESSSQLEDKPAALITDIATDPNGQVLQEATGKISTIYVIVPIDGKPRIASGGVYSYYEFKQPLAQRLTDETWKAMVINDKNMPEVPQWVASISASAK